ncbi:hypothetical protein SDC9_163568 [bioreactor metagenome]|uniref:Uncharacterized protein n=1 Tax=bioreactor metagenome TaxID=1076179 RepID=A0A645FQQ2_9ZZZZ
MICEISVNPFKRNSAYMVVIKHRINRVFGGYAPAVGNFRIFIEGMIYIEACPN